MIRHLYLWLFILFSAPAVLAEPVAYKLDLEASEVAFFFTMNGRETKGLFPVERSQAMIAPQNLGQSHFDVTLRTAHARAGGAIVTMTLKGGRLLDTKTYPTARFVSRRVVPTGTGARITGDLTLKGVTKPLTLVAMFNWSNGFETLRADMSGEINRHDFGVSGFSRVVGDKIALRFQVELSRQ